MSDHRKPKKKPRKPGYCQWCGKVIYKNGTINRRSTWHPICVEEYKIQAWPDHARRIIFGRDRGLCQACGAFDPKWQLDHIVPLIDKGSKGLENMQTLCLDCHKAKTSKENSESKRKK